MPCPNLSSKAHCTKLVRLAKAMMADGLEASGSSSVIYEISKLNPNKAESRIHELLSENRLALPIPLRPIVGKPHVDGFPRLRPLDFLTYMSESGHLNKLLGGRSIDSCQHLLREFWSNYQNLHPDFELYHVQDLELDYGDCIPIMCHIDGGRGYKKSEFMVFSFSSVIGLGCGKKNQKDPDVRSFKKAKNGALQIPLLGHSFLSHYLFAAMPSSFHKHSEEAFQEILETFAEDLRACFDEGIAFRDRVLRLVLLGLKGDLKLQARAGQFSRWYSTARKKPFDPNMRNQTAGRCCWLCPAGDIQTPYEEISSKAPAWWRAMDTFREPPWQAGCPGGMLPASLSYMERPEKFYLPDLFHIYLAGVGQDFAASCLVYMLPHMFRASHSVSVDSQLEQLNAAFKVWRKMFKVSVNLTSFNRDRLTFPDASKVFPTGTWSKAADTSRIIQFISYTCSLFPELCEPGGDSICRYINLAAVSIEDMMKGLYDADLWIETGLTSRKLLTLLYLNSQAKDIRTKAIYKPYENTILKVFVFMSQP